MRIARSFRQKTVQNDVKFFDGSVCQNRIRTGISIFRAPLVLISDLSYRYCVDIVVYSVRVCVCVLCIQYY